MYVQTHRRADMFKKRASQRANATAKKQTAALLASMAPLAVPQGSLPIGASGDAEEKKAKTKKKTKKVGGGAKAKACD